MCDHRDLINHCFSYDTLEGIFNALSALTTAWGVETLATLNAKSPTSLKVALHQLRQGRSLNFDECMQMEYRLASRFLLSHDFSEGIRALIIDKDQSPNWLPSEMKAVSNEEVEHYFAPLAEEFENAHR